jgi:hypothetical protein
VLLILVYKISIVTPQAFVEVELDGVGLDHGPSPSASAFPPDFDVGACPKMVGLPVVAIDKLDSNQSQDPRGSRVWVLSSSGDIAATVSFAVTSGRQGHTITPNRSLHHPSLSSEAILAFESLRQTDKAWTRMASLLLHPPFIC